MANLFKDITDQLKVTANLRDLQALSDDDLRQLQWILHNWSELSISEMEHRREINHPAS